MSTILNALRRLERERGARAENLRHQVVARSTSAEPRPRLPLLAAAGAGGAVLVVAGFVYLEGRFAGPPAPAAPVAEIAAVAAPPALPAALREAYPFPDERPEYAPEPAPRSHATIVPARAAPPPVLPAVAAPPPPAAEAVPGIVGQPEVVVRTRLPHVLVERTLWHPTRDRRLAFLQVEGREGIVELHEGDAVGDLVVQQIDPSAVLFLHRGVEIRRRVGAGS